MICDVMYAQVLEGIGYTGLKVVNNWYAFWSAGDDKQIQHWFFWVRARFENLIGKHVGI